MEFNNIGFFQFNNLVQNRVPFLLVLLDEVDVKPWYNSLVQMHLENISIFCAPGEVLETVQAKKLPPHFAIIVLDKDQKRSPKVVKELEKAGHSNVYFVKDGFEGLLTERKQ
ncbi:MAG: rhodanese-like domain-containing protein [Bdellovibrio sp.]